MSRVTIVKCTHKGEETWRYSGELLEKGANSLKVEAFFDRSDMPFHGMLLGKGDRFIEMYYTDRWYNIFQIHSRDDDSLRGWYCNITFPVEFDDSIVYWKDLALDLLVFPDGRQIVLDEDEFAALDISSETRMAAWKALEELQALFRDHRLNFYDRQ